MRWFIVAALFAIPAQAEQLDKTGVDWVLPFEKALAKAKAEKRILLIKPIAFGTSPDGGW
jgi:hypothetical protein